MNLNWQGINHQIQSSSLSASWRRSSSQSSSKCSSNCINISLIWTTLTSFTQTTPCSLSTSFYISRLPSKSQLISSFCSRFSSSSLNSLKSSLFPIMCRGHFSSLSRVTELRVCCLMQMKSSRNTTLTLHPFNDTKSRLSFSGNTTKDFLLTDFYSRLTLVRKTSFDRPDTSSTTSPFWTSLS